MRVKPYGPLPTMAVVGRLVGTFEPALVIVTMAQANNPSARTKTIAPRQRAGSWAGRNDKGMVAALIEFATAVAVTLHYRRTKRRLPYA